ncbi:hypothetical protein C8F01DRAFT_1364346 [Mycena amicta]|nr:hypothetical protein C8F01DRAFT_1364346 [Mycena amicta]
MAAGALFSLSLNLGPLLCGAFICIFFFGIICMQTVNYLKTFPNDMLAMKCTVIFLWTVQLGYTICICHGTYTMTVTDFGEVFALLFTPWGLNAAVVLGSIIDHGVQCFFVVRIFRVTGALYLSLFLWIMVALLLTLSLVVAVEAIRTDSIPIMESKYHWPLLLLFYGDAAMDLVNAAVLCFYLAVQRRSAMSTRTAAIVDQLVVYTLRKYTLLLFVVLIDFALQRLGFRRVWLPSEQLSHSQLQATRVIIFALSSSTK